MNKKQQLAQIIMAKRERNPERVVIVTDVTDDEAEAALQEAQKQSPLQEILFFRVVYE